MGGPMTGGVKAVKDAIESVYDCLGISCTDVGAYQSSGVVYAGMDACTFAPSMMSTPRRPAAPPFQWIQIRPRTAPALRWPAPLSRRQSSRSHMEPPLARTHLLLC